MAMTSVELDDALNEQFLLIENAVEKISHLFKEYKAANVSLAPISIRNLELLAEDLKSLHDMVK